MTYEKYFLTLDAHFDKILTIREDFQILGEAYELIIY